MSEDKKFQVFVSSTYTDLIEHRREIMQALLELDCIPSGMELFPAADDTQWNLIKQVIDDCDYYVVVVAGRYGSLGESGLSYTEMEYRYALEKNKPIIGFLHREPGRLERDQCETTKEGQEKLEAFRALVQRKACKYWTTPHELGGEVSRGLINLKKSRPAVGWVRADKLAGDEAAQEILRLRRRVETLEGDISAAQTTAPVGTSELAQGDDPTFVRASYFQTYGGTEADDPSVYTWSNEVFPVTWNDLFYACSPLMINEASKNDLVMRYDKFVKDTVVDEIATQRGRFRGHQLHPPYVSADHDEFETTLIQFDALGLITQSNKARSLKNAGDYWTLTPYGRSVMNRLRAVPRPAVPIPDSVSS